VLVFFAACSQDAALKLEITTAEQRPETCFEVKIANELGSATVQRADAGVTEVVINQGTFPPEVGLRVEAWVTSDGGCAAPHVANGAVSVDAHFSKGLTTVEAKLEQLADLDGDHAVAASAGGADCDDNNAQRSPFFAEDCGHNVDLDCDGAQRCADTECAMQCRGMPSTLVFDTVPTMVSQGMCSNAIRLEAHDLFDDPVALASGLVLSAPGVTFSSTPDCLGAAPIAVPQTGLLVYVRATQAGTVTLTASAAGLTSATQELTVVALPSIRIIPGNGTITATRCESVGLQLLDIDGGNYVSGSPLEIFVDGTSPLSLLSDCNSAQPRTSLTVSGVSSTAAGFVTSHAGPFTLTASATGFVSGTAIYNVAAGPGYAFAVDAGSQLNAAACDPITITWADDAGNPSAPGVTQLSSDLPLFGDQTCSTVLGQPALIGTFYVKPADQGDYALAIDAGTSNGDFTLHAVRPFPPEALVEIPLTIHTGASAPFNGYAGYSLLTIIDSGAPLPGDFNQLRSYFWSATGWVEIDRVYGQYGANQWQIWFKGQTDIANDTSDTRYALFVMSPSSQPAKSSADAVWLFNDSFDKTGLERWADGGTQWVLDETNGLSGTASLRNLGNDGGAELTFGLASLLNEKDVSVQAWWKSADLASVNFAQQLRVQPPNGNVTWVGHELNKASTEWRLATYSNSTTYTGQGALGGTNPGQVVNGWSLVLVRMCGGVLDGVGPTGYANANIGSPLGAGSIGFRSSNVTHAPVNIDDVVVRRYICPEPVTTVLPSRTSP